MAETSPEIEDDVLDEDAPSSYSTSTPETRGGGSSITAPGAATGRRKEAIARVRLVPGTGTWRVNGRTLEAYFPNKVHQQLVNEPFVTLGAESQFDVADRAEAARVTRVPVGALLLALRTGQRDLAGVDDDDEVAGVDVRRERRLVLAPQERGDVAGEPAEDDVRRVDDVPAPLDLGGLGGVGAHSRSLRPRPGGLATAPDRHASPVNGHG